MSSNNTFTIEGRGLKLDSAADVQEFIDTISGMDELENVILSGNTFGVEACRALAAALAKKPLLKVGINPIQLTKQSTIVRKNPIGSRLYRLCVDSFTFLFCM